MYSVEDMSRAGCTTPRGIRFWEEQGLLGKVERSDKGTRRFSDKQMDAARIIAAAQFGGWQLEEIKQMLIEWGPEVADAIVTRLADQARAAARLVEQLPQPPSAPRAVEYDL